MQGSDSSVSLSCASYSFFPSCFSQWPFQALAIHDTLCCDWLYFMILWMHPPTLSSDQQLFIIAIPLQSDRIIACTLISYLNHQYHAYAWCAPAFFYKAWIIEYQRHSKSKWQCSLWFSNVSRVKDIMKS